MVAEEKRRRIAEKPIAIPEPEMKQLNLSYGTVTTEISSQVADGRIFAQFQDDLDQVNELRRQYREKVKAVLIKWAQANNDIAAVHHRAYKLAEKITGQEIQTVRTPQIELDRLREWIWLENDLRNEMPEIMRAALEETNPEAKLPPVRIQNEITPTSRQFQDARQL
jgi:hypothetical protein